MPILNLPFFVRYFLLLTLLGPFSLGFAQVSFTANQTQGCTPLPVQFTASVPPGATAYAWDFGDGTSSNQANAGRIYTTPGVYTVTLTVTFASGPPQSSTQTAFISVFGNPTAAFSANPTRVCRGAPISFTDQSTGSSAISSWQWNFGDGQSSATQNPTHIYGQAGIYSVSLQVTDVNGCTDVVQRSGYVAVNKPDARFSFNASSACNPPLNVQFTHTGSSVVSHQWDFGDGNTSTAANPSHSYTGNGTFTVTHIVTDADGCTDTLRIPGAINVGSNQATIIASPTTICPGDTVFFDCVNSSALSVSWTFNGGFPRSSTNCRPFVVYNNPGTYTAILSITVPGNCQLSARTTITVRPRPTINLTPVNRLFCDPPATINFSANTNAGPNATYIWTYGDGNSSSTLSATHTYTSPGTYFPLIQVIDRFGCFNSRPAGRVTIRDIVPTATPLDTGGCKALTVNFRDLSTPANQINSWFWDFGNGDTSTTQNPVYTYQDTGVYTVKLVVTDTFGCRDSIILRNAVEVGDSVSADFRPLDTVICGSGFAQFRDTSRGDVDSWKWFIGGRQYNTPTFKKSFQDTGYFGVTLIVADRGCSDTLRRDSVVQVLPAIAAVQGNFTGCDTPHTVLFRNESRGGNLWRWFLETPTGLDSTNVFQPIQVYDTMGTFNVTLIALDTLTGCADTAEQQVQVELIDAAVTVSPQRGCVPLSVQFNGSSQYATSVLWNFGGGNISASPTPTRTYTQPGRFRATFEAFNSIGCKADTTVEILAFGPLINFSVLDNTVCAPTTLQFNNNTSSLAPVVSYQWNFGPLGNSTLRSPTVIYQQQGRYPVTLTVVDTAGCTATETRPNYISVGDPQAQFSVDYPVNCRNNVITFTNLSTGNPGLTFAWDFGDGQTSTQRTPQISYTNNGTYTVELVVTDTSGCQDTATRQIIIADAAVSFTADTLQTNCPPLLVNFQGTALSPHVFTSWAWDFGDGNQGFSASPSNLYVNPGVFGVQVVATTNSGCTDTFEISPLITVNGPDGSVSFGPREGCPGLTVSFSAVDSNAVSSLVDFGDGTLLNGNPLLRNFSYTYNQAGTYKPILILTDTTGCRRPISPPDSVIIRPLPQPDFGAQPSLLCDSGVVRFSDQSTGTPAVSYRWDFGDGSPPAFGASPQHFYRQPGTYSVKLTTTNGFGCIDSVTRLAVTVVQSPQAALRLADTAGCEPFLVKFFDASTPGTGLITAWDWQFGTGESSSRASDSVSLTTPGRIPLRLRITDANGCSSQIDTALTVWPLPVVDFEVLPDSFGCAPLISQFQDLTQPQTVAWSWDFGDGGTASSQNPTHTYIADGTYTVSLTATDFRGCTNTRTKPNYIRLRSPVADFTAPITEGCPGLTVNFLDLSLSDTSIVNWRWDFGEGGTSTASNPAYTYTQSGTYDVRLIIEDFFGCRDTLEKSPFVRIVPDIVPEAPPLQRVTVEDENSVRVEWLPYNDLRQDFGRYVLYKASGQGWNQIFATDDITRRQYLDANADPEAGASCYRLAVENSCGTESEAALSDPHCTVFLTTIPGQDQITLNWTPYEGWLVSEYRIYRTNAYVGGQPIATVSGDQTSYTDAPTFCYDSRSYRILAIRADGLISRSNLSAATPIHFPLDEPLPLVRATVEENAYVRVEWGAPPEWALGQWIILERDAGTGFREIYRQPYRDANRRYDDQSTEVATTSYRYRAFVLDSCGDLNPVGLSAKTIVLDGDRRPGAVDLLWSGYEGWAEGVRRYRIEVRNDALGAFVPLGVVAEDARTFVDTTTDFVQPQYCYRIIADELRGNDTTSFSNTVCVDVDPVLFAPNAFTPNGDGRNERFYIKGAFLGDFHLQIYSRWGLLLYESFDREAGWDGRYQGRDMPEGVYVYKVRATGYDGQSFSRTGTITLIR